MTRWQQYHRLPRALHKARLDNIALVPASLLPYRARYQAIANRLPHGDILIVLPGAETPGRQLLESTARLFKAKGHGVKIVLAQTVSNTAPCGADTHGVRSKG